MGKVPALHPQGPDFGPPRIHIEAMHIVCVWVSTYKFQCRVEGGIGRSWGFLAMLQRGELQVHRETLPHRNKMESNSDISQPLTSRWEFAGELTLFPTYICMHVQICTHAHTYPFTPSLKTNFEKCHQ